MFLQSQHTVLQKFGIRHDQILSIRRISAFGKCWIPSDSNSKSVISLVATLALTLTITYLTLLTLLTLLILNPYPNHYDPLKL